MSSAFIKIPKKRIAVLIGKDGKTKKTIEKKTNTIIKIDSRDGSVEIIPKEDIDGIVNLWKARDIVKAIGRGFSPERAFKLFDDDVYFEVIDLEQFFNSKKSIHRIKGRIIGNEGKSRALIEKLTDTYISVYGNTVSIIGEFQPFKVAKKAIMLLIQGATHSKVFRFLHKKHKELQKQKYSLWKIVPETREDFEDIEPL
ncbi:MAG: KH domain-containing protein [Candidatus Helarchaeota archaeon]